MLDKDKVLAGMAACTDSKDCEECPYDEEYERSQDCMYALIMDMAELIYEGEPRVMTLEEIQELHVYWIEDYNGSLIPETVMCVEPHFGNLEGSSKEIQTIPVVRMGNGYAPVITKINHHYNIKWRCWTSRPTDEQREAVKWDAAD